MDLAIPICHRGWSGGDQRLGFFVDCGARDRLDLASEILAGESGKWRQPFLVFRTVMEVQEALIAEPWSSLLC
jgi:hypothetical protein